MDSLTPEKRSWNMSRIRAQDTKIEVRLRKALWHAGIRYRKNYKALPGKPDIVITKHRIAIFCDSSFWHGRDYANGRKPKTNTEYWDKKICRNMKRDCEVDQALRGMGWNVVRFWDTDIEKDLEGCVKTVQEAIFDVAVIGKEPMDYGEADD